MSYEWTEPVRAGRRRHAEQPPRNLRQELATAIHRAADALFPQQAPDGFWCGELTADTTLESDYILLQLWLHQPGDDGWNPPRPRPASTAPPAPSSIASCPMAASISTPAAPPTSAPP